MTTGRLHITRPKYTLERLGRQFENDVDVTELGLGLGDEVMGKG